MKISAGQVRRFLDGPDKSTRAVLLYGPNESLVHEAAQRLTRWSLGKSDDPYAVTKLSEDDIRKDVARLGDALAAQSLLGGPTVVWARIAGKSADASIIEALDAIEAGEPSGFLVVEAGDLASSSALVKAFAGAKKAAVAAFYEESDAERAQFAKSLAADLGLSFEPGAEADFLAALPADRGLARQEIEKVALYANELGRKLSSAEIGKLLTDETEGAIDAASAAAAQGKADEAVEALARIDGLSGVSALRALLRRMHQLRDARAMIDEGASPADAISKLRPPVFWKERDAVAAQARLWTSKKLNAAFEVLWQAELRSKIAGAPQALIAADAYRGVAKLVA